jgi:hypothetical protein
MTAATQESKNAFMMTTPFLRQLHSSFIRFYSDGWPALGAMDNLRAASRELTYC